MTRTLRRLARLAIVALGPPPVEDYRERYEQARADIDAARTRYRRLFDCDDGDPVAGLVDALACEVTDLRGRVDTVCAVADAAEQERDEARRALATAERDVDEMAGMLSTLRAEHAADMAESDRLLAVIEAWTHDAGNQYVPTGGDADTFGDGVRRAQCRVLNILGTRRLTPPPDRNTV